jgi:hypothetical protein
MSAIPLEEFKRKLLRRTGTGKIRHEVMMGLHPEWAGSVKLALGYRGVFHYIRVGSDGAGEGMTLCGQEKLNGYEVHASMSERPDQPQRLCRKCAAAHGGFERRVEVTMAEPDRNDPDWQEYLRETAEADRLRDRAKHGDPAGAKAATEEAAAHDAKAKEAFTRYQAKKKLPMDRGAGRFILYDRKAHAWRATS